VSVSFHISTLARKRLRDNERFGENYLHPWLVWELGAIVADTRAKQDLLATALPPTGEMLRPSKSDPVCFPLVRPATILGRGEGSDIVIPDATVSRNHVLLRQMTDAWQVQPIGQQTPVVVAGAVLQLGAPHSLQSEDRISLGGVELVFLESDALIQRLDNLNRARR
jgi:pSer/pThr/pTyr-binding forkhead associated (FHA) protein